MGIGEVWQDSEDTDYLTRASALELSRSYNQ